jgi:4-diphosphocytidyl-2-C-methyl-D-erythritol kinase
MAGRLTVRAYAKINLDLRVLGRRPDGFHELRTLVQSIDLFDTLACRLRGGPLAVGCRAPGVPAGEGNLVWKAGAMLWRAIGRGGPPDGAVISIIKRVPAGAGLGGGSADAAGALRLLVRVWKAKLNASRLDAIGSAIGADVPFFLHGGTALGLGRGDAIHPVEDLDPRWVVLVFPGFSVATVDAYAWYDLECASPGQDAPVPARARGRHLSLTAAPPLGSFRNDLEAAVTRRHPQLAAIRARLKALGAEVASMSGSGSTMFGLFRSRAAARSAARSISGSGLRTVVVSTLTRPAWRRGTRLVHR